MVNYRRPNVLILYTDQQRKDTLGCYGNTNTNTPNLDRMAREGAVFNNYFVQNPVCMPSRMSFLTGRYCSAIGIGTNGIPLEEETITINKMLKPYGYHSAQIGKLHFQPHSRRDHKDSHTLYGFDTFILSDEPGCYDDAYTKWVEVINPEMLCKVRTSLPPAAEEFGADSFSDIPRETHEPYVFEGGSEYTHSSFVASEMCKFLKSQDKKKPFFAIAGFYAPHTPVNPPECYVKLIDKMKIDVPLVGEQEEIMDILKDLTEDDWREIRAYYYALVSHVDDCVGQILKTLQEENLDEDTIVIFTSDHGEYLGDHGRIQKGMPGHDCITNVPFIIKYPKKIKKDMVLNNLVEGVDIVPTILDFCGIQKPNIVQGKSLKNLLVGEEYVDREDVLTEFFEPNNTYRASTIRTKEYKYYIDNNGNEILYNLIKDPNELINVVNDSKYKDELTLMRRKMILRLFDVNDSSKVKTAPY